MKLVRKEEELLEAIWSAEEKNNPSLEMIQSLSHTPVKERTLDRLANAGFINKDGLRITLTSKGKDKAQMVIRRHRLAERLLHDILSMSVEDTESNACEFEHVLAPEVTESICTLLGHPRECPHGTPIPEGRCCREARRQIRSLVVPVTELAPGESGKVAYISSGHHPRLHMLISFGVAPGSLIKVHQKYPSYIIQCEHTELALEENVAKDIYVWRQG